MRAILRTEFGGPDGLVIREIPEPEPKAGYAKLLEQIGAPLPELTAWVSTLIEILGGLAILAGAFVAAVSIPLIVLMLVAMFTIHLRYGFSAINTIGLTADGPQFGPPGYEINLLYI